MLGNIWILHSIISNKHLGRLFFLALQVGYISSPPICQVSSTSLKMSRIEKLYINFSFSSWVKRQMWCLLFPMSAYPTLIQGKSFSYLHIWYKSYTFPLSLLLCIYFIYICPTGSSRSCGLLSFSSIIYFDTVIFLSYIIVCHKNVSIFLIGFWLSLVELEGYC